MTVVMTMTILIIRIIIRKRNNRSNTLTYIRNALGDVSEITNIICHVTARNVYENITSNIQFPLVKCVLLCEDDWLV